MDEIFDSIKRTFDKVWKREENFVKGDGYKNPREIKQICSTCIYWEFAKIRPSNFDYTGLRYGKCNSPNVTGASISIPRVISKSKILFRDDFKCEYWRLLFNANQ